MNIFPHSKFNPQVLKCFVLLSPLPKGHNDGSFEKLLMLHGIACTHKVWDPISTRLPHDMGVYAPDLRFHGRSRIPSGQENFSCSMSDCGQDLIETMTKTNFYPAWLVGHSMGARVAVAAAILHPEWIKGLVLVDHPIHVSKGEFRILFGNFLEGLPSHFPSHEHAMNYLRNACPDPSSAPILASGLIQKLGGNVEFDFDKKNVLKTFHSLPMAPYADWLHVLGQQEKPVLVMRGNRSAFWSKLDWDGSRLLFGQYRSFKFLEVDGAGHGVPFEMPEVFLKELLHFIQREKIT